MPTRRPDPAGADGGPARGHVTLREVADAAGVHYSTASRALNPERARRINPRTVQRVQAAADRLGYVPHMLARSLREGRTNTIGVVVADLEVPFIAQVIRGIEDVLERDSLTALIVETQDDPDRFRRILDHLSSRRVDAVITTSARLSSEGMLQDFTERVAPVVLAVRRIPGSGLPSVCADDRRGGELVAGYLMELGHRTVAQLVGPQDVQPFIDRRVGFEETVGRLGREVLPMGIEARYPTFEEGSRLMLELLTREDSRPTALFAHNDAMALGALDVMRKSHLRCPWDISLMGFNDSWFSPHMTPSLSTVRIHDYEIGTEAARMAARALKDGQSVEDVEISPLLVPRASTARLAASP
jgi:LacI family transcriptional regulator